MTISHKSSNRQKGKESTKSGELLSSGFLDNSGSVDDSSMFSDESSLSKLSKFFTKSRSLSDSRLFRQYRESIDIDFVHYLLVVQRHWVPATSIFVGTVMLSALATTFVKPSYEAVGKLLFKTPAFNTIGTNLLPSSQESSGDLKPLVSTQNPISTQMEVISSPLILQQTIDKLRLKDGKSQPLDVETFGKSLKVQIVGGADVLKITYKSRSPKESAAVVNTVIDTYLKNDILTSQSEAKATRQQMAKQLPANRGAVQGAESALRIFKQKNNIVNLNEETKSAVATIGTLDTQISGIRAELDRETAQTNKLRQQVALNSQDAISASALSQSPAVKATLAELQDLERQLANKRSQFQNENPVIINLEAKKANLKTLLQEQITQINGTQLQPKQGLLQIGELRQTLIGNFLQSEVQRLGLTQKLASLQNSKANYERRMQSLPQLEQQQRELERRLEIPQATYQTLLKKVRELQVAESNTSSTARIISQALVPKEAAPSPKALFLLLGVLSGLFLATALIVLLEIRLNAKYRAASVPGLKQLQAAKTRVRSHINTHN